MNVFVISSTSLVGVKNDLMAVLGGNGILVVLVLSTIP